jgi:Icc protein
MKRLLGLITIVLILVVEHVQADIPRVSNLQFSANPVTLGELFTISIQFEGDVERLFIENTWEEQGGAIKQETKEFPISSDMKEKQRGVITQKWKVASGAHKPYRILKVWVNDASGNQSNTLSDKLNLLMSEEAPFRKGLPKEKNYYHIVVLSDLHLPGRMIPTKEKVIKTINSSPEVDMVVLLGDICEHFGTVEEYAYAKKFLSQLNKPFFPVVGNHEYIYDDSIPGKYVKASYSSRKKKLQRFKETFSLEEVFYSKRVESYLLIFLSADDLYSNYLTEISGKQLDWLQSELGKNKNIPTIIFFHSPLKGTLTGNNEVVGDDNFIAQPHRKVHKIISENPQIFLWVSGHTHIAPTNANFNHKVNIYENRVTNIHNCDMDGRSFLSETDTKGKGHTSIWTNSLFLYPEQVLIKTYDHKKDNWLENLGREIKLPKIRTSAICERGIAYLDLKDRSIHAERASR